jgi:hypothetical protein
VSDYQLVVEKQIKLSVASWDQGKRADVVWESFSDFARYPSGSQSMASGHAVFDSDIQLLDAAVSTLIVRYGPPPKVYVPHLST